MRTATITPKKLLKLAEENPLIDWANRVNEIEMKYKSRPRTPKYYPVIEGSKSAEAIIREHYKDLLSDTIEYFSILFLNKGMKVIGFQVVSMGGISGTVADPRIIMKAALLVEASYLILAHNHPSGQLRPSQADISITQKLKQAGEMLDIKILDHVIISSTGYTSLTDEGVI